MLCEWKFLACPGVKIEPVVIFKVQAAWWFLKGATCKCSTDGVPVGVQPVGVRDPVPKACSPLPGQPSGISCSLIAAGVQLRAQLFIQLPEELACALRESRSGRFLALPAWRDLGSEDAPSLQA